MELLRGRVELWVVLVALSAIGQANGMSKKYTFDEGCNATNCPPTYIGDIFGWEQDRYAMCLDATVCRCEAPFAGPNCENWFKTDDVAHTWGNIVVYAFEGPVLIYLLVGSFLILMRKLKRREEAANKISTQVLFYGLKHVLDLREQTRYGQAIVEGVVLDELVDFRLQIFSLD